ncbi:MAG: YitT family protein [Synergistaceae bacterium]|nr:YitT family protein [Synergistaceae bacterium]
MHNHRIEFSRRGLKKFLKLSRVVVRAEFRTMITVCIGLSIYVFGVMEFTVPFRFPDSGVTGIAVLLRYSAGISLPVSIAAANVLLLVWAWRELSLRFVLWSIFSVAYTTLLMHFMDEIPFPHTDQRLLIALIGGAVKGYGSGLVIRAGASGGGLDIVTLYLRKKFGVEVGKYNFYINMVIIGASAFVVGVENAMLGLIGAYASSVSMDNAITEFDKRRLILVVTRDPAPIVEYISSDLMRGSTIIDAHGGYSGDFRPMVMCVLTRRQAVDLKRFLSEKHPGTFMIVTDASEVLGKGFKSWRR